MPITPGPWTMTKCGCRHPSCNQYTISTQGSVGFDEDDAKAIIEVPAMVEALRAINADYRDDDGDVMICADELRHNELADEILAILARIDRKT